MIAVLRRWETSVHGDEKERRGAEQHRRFQVISMDSDWLNNKVFLLDHSEMVSVDASTSVGYCLHKRITTIKQYLCVDMRVAIVLCLVPRPSASQPSAPALPPRAPASPASPARLP